MQNRHWEICFITIRWTLLNHDLPLNHWSYLLRMNYYCLDSKTFATVTILKQYIYPWSTWAVSWHRITFALQLSAEAKGLAAICSLHESQKFLSKAFCYREEQPPGQTPQGKKYVSFLLGCCLPFSRPVNVAAHLWLMVRIGWWNRIRCSEGK